MMNKYIKKCLITYISLILVLCGMTGAAYAITSADAYNYVTRSEYATDMQKLQMKLDETESDIMGKINRYRSTDVKFVTWDTPTKYDTSNRNGGRYNGGNYNARRHYTNASMNYNLGYAGGTDNNTKQQGRYTSYAIYRLWNGNYYFTKDLYYSEHASSQYYFYQTTNYAVPVENFPGWYLEVKLHYRASFMTAVFLSLIKLDPNATSVPTSTDVLQIRFKKDLFHYVGDNVEPLTTTKTSGYTLFGIYNNSAATSPLSFQYRTDVNISGTASFYTENWIDADTGDYMMTIRGMNRCYAISSGNYTNITYRFGDNKYIATVIKIIPVDNVEYVTGNLYGNYWTYNHDTGRLAIPSACAIGTGFLNDPYWTYEFVDGINGIKYWHAYRPPSTVQKGNTAPIPFGIHYSLPIVY